MTISVSGRSILAQVVRVDTTYGNKKFRDSDHLGNHQMVAAAPTCREMSFAIVMPRESLCNASKRTPLALTGRQKLALMLEKAGYSHAEIAEKLGIHHRQAASRLIARARAAAKAMTTSFEEFVDRN